jgi:hypothetical protein
VPATFVSDIRLRGLEIPVVTSFPTGERPFKKVIRSDLSFTEWTWNPFFGSAGEWMGPQTVEVFQRASVATNVFLTRGNAVTSAIVGGPIYEFQRIIRVFGVWANAITAINNTIELTVNGTTGSRTVPSSFFPVSATSFIFNPPINENTIWRIGSLADPSGRRVLGSRWFSASSQTLTNLSIRVEMIQTRLTSQ